MSDNGNSKGRIPAEEVRCSPVPLVVGDKGMGMDNRPVKIVPVEEDGVIRYIEVHCSCGRVTVLECIYKGEAKK